MYLLIEKNTQKFAQALPPGGYQNKCACARLPRASGQSGWLQARPYVSEFRRSCKKVKEKRPMVAQLHFLKQLSRKPSHSSGELGDGRLQIPFGQKEGRSRRRTRVRDAPRHQSESERERGRGGGAGGGSCACAPCSGLARSPACLGTASSRGCWSAPASAASPR